MHIYGAHTRRPAKLRHRITAKLGQMPLQMGVQAIGVALPSLLWCMLEPHAMDRHQAGDILRHDSDPSFPGAPGLRHQRATLTVTLVLCSVLLEGLALTETL